MSHSFDIHRLSETIAPQPIEPIEHDSSPEIQPRITPEVFFELLESKSGARSLSGADVFKMLLEESDLLPTEQYIEKKTDDLLKYQSLYEKEVAQPNIIHSKLHQRQLAALNIFGNQISPEMLQNIADELQKIASDRRETVQIIYETQQGFIDEFYTIGADGEPKIDVLKIGDLYDETDPYVEEDTLLLFANEVTQLARNANNDKLRQCTYDFERLARFMFWSFYKDNQFDKEE